MADITLFEANRYLGDITWLAQYYGAKTATNFEIIDSSGVLRESNIGTNFTYGWNGFFSTGKITSAFFFSSSGSLGSQWANLDVDVATRNSLLSIGTSSYAFFQYFLRGNDNILGSTGNDLLYGSKGSDNINGGGGIDVLSFNQFSEAVTVNFSTGQAITSDGISVISNVEDIEGSTYNDTLTGDSGNNQIQGFGGNDKIDGGAGVDTAVYFDASAAVNINLATGIVTGGSGDDTLISIERVIGSRFDDTIKGSNANESFLGGLGADTIDGGGGIDVIKYDSIGSGVVVNLATGLATGGGGNDIISNVENITGSVFNDTLIGNNLANILRGGNGNDKLNGDAGKDTLSGGEGSDTFVFQFGQSLITGIDRITDFAIGVDKIELRNQTGAKINAPSIFTRAGNSAVTSLSDVAKQLFLDANGAIAGNQALGVNSATLVQVTTTGIAGTYLAINDGSAGFQANNDLFIDITGYTGTLPGLGAISVNTVFA